MASSYVNDLRLNEMATGDASGTWGETTNTNLELIAEAFSYGTEAITTNADTHTTTIADGATDPGRALYLKYTGTLDSACTITIGPNTVSKVWIIENGTSGSQDIILSQGSGANITIPAGDTKVVYSDGAGAGAAFVDAFASLSVVDLKVQDDLTVTDDLIVNGDIDLEGNMDVNGSLETDALSLNGTTVTSTAAEINLLDGSSANTVVNSKAVIYGSSGEVAGTLSTAAQPNITSVGTLTGFTSTGIDDNADATAITIDSSTTGIVTAAGTSVFTNLDISGDIDVDGTTNLDVVDIDGALTQDGGAVFNEASADVDFRVESDNDANALFVQGSDGFVGIGTASPTEKLSVLGGHVSVGDTTGVGGTEFLLEGYREVSGGTKYGNTSIRTTYDISSNASDMLFYTAVSGTNTDERLRID
jgi:cytoskeletal protein CcmA (bactofilin family)